MYLIQEKWIYSFWRGRFTSQKLCQAKTWIIESTLSRWKQPLCRAETITAGQIEQQMCWDESDWIKSRLGERLIGLPGWRTSGAPPPHPHRVGWNQTQKDFLQVSECGLLKKWLHVITGRRWTQRQLCSKCLEPDPTSAKLGYFPPSPCRLCRVHAQNTNKSLSTWLGIFPRAPHLW